MITIMLVEDHVSYRQALEAVVSLEPDLTVVARVGRGDEAAAEAARHTPTVAVVDLDLPGTDGVEALAAIRRVSPDTRCVVLTALTDNAELGRAIEAGAGAVVHKSVEITDLLAAVRRVARGASLLVPDETARRLQALAARRDDEWQARLLRDTLTPRELQVLDLLAQGDNNDDIAQMLDISRDTVQTHVRNLMGKLDVGSRLEAVIVRLRFGLVEPPV